MESDAASGFRGFGPMGELETLLAPDFRVITYDRRGRGESTDTELGLDLILDRLKGIRIKA